MWFFSELSGETIATPLRCTAEFVVDFFCALVQQNWLDREEQIKHLSSSHIGERFQNQDFQVTGLSLRPTLLHRRGVCV